MLTRLALILALSFALTGVNPLQAQQSSVDQSKEEQQSKKEKTNWLIGIWQITSATVVENGNAEAIKRPQDILLITENLEIEISLPNAAMRSPMLVAGSKFVFQGQDKSGMQFVRSTFDPDLVSKDGKLRFTVEPKDEKKAQALVEYLHQRENGTPWKYQLEITRIDNEKRISEIATMIQPFLDGTADLQVYGQSGLDDGEGRQKTDEVYVRAIRECFSLTRPQRPK